jgi:undecaprenyl-diphosphatase
MKRAARAGVKRIWTPIVSRDRDELKLIVAAIVLVGITVALLVLVGRVLEGDTQHFDERILKSLRRADNPAEPIGPAWLKIIAEDITALGSATVLGLTVFAVVGFLTLQGMYKNATFVLLASIGGWFLNDLLKSMFARPRPSIVPHLREVWSLSFPSGHALTSAVVYLTLGVLMMRFSERRLVKWYCITLAMMATALVGMSRVYLGVHYPTDVLGGWLIGLCWALAFWLIERALERRAGLKTERAEAQ